MSAALVWKIRDTILTFERPLIMGVLNLTPDSFSDGGQWLNPESALTRAVEMEEEGADLIDVGAESTRPGAKAVSAAEEWRRLFPALQLILSKVRIPVSLDTTKSEIAARALAAGVSVINDVSGFHNDSGMASLVRQYGAGIVLMHRRGTPQTMQQFTSYRNLIQDISDELSKSVSRAVHAGISENQIVVDPGLGFAKTSDQNFELIRHLKRFSCFGRPVLAGASRKSFLGTITGRAPSERVFASTAVCALMAERGANILRVHDVRAARDALLVTREIIR